MARIEPHTVEQAVRNMIAAGLRLRAWQMPDQRGAELNHCAMLVEMGLLHIPDGTREYEIAELERTTQQGQTG